MPDRLEERIQARIRARAAIRSAARGGIAGPLERPDPIFSDLSSPDPAAIIQAGRGDTIAPMVITAKREPGQIDKLFKKLQKISAGATATPLTPTGPAPSWTEPVAEFAHELFTKPAYEGLAPMQGAKPYAGLLGGEDPQLQDIAPIAPGPGTVTPGQKARGLASTAINVGWPGAQGAATKLAVEELGKGATARIAGSMGTGAGLLGAHGALEGGLEPANDFTERLQNIINRGITGAETGAISAGILHGTLGEVVPWIARGMTETAKLAAMRDYRPKPAESPARALEGIPAGDISSVRPWPKGSVTKEQIFSPGNIRRFERVKSTGLEGDPELRRRIQAGEDLTDVEVHRAEPNNLTVYDVLQTPHPTKPGTTIGAEIKRQRIRVQTLHPPRTSETPLNAQLDPEEVISGLERTRKAKGGDEFGDVGDVIEKIRADQEAGRPLTLGRLRTHQRDAVLEHGQRRAREAGVDLKNDGVVIVLAGPPGSGKSTIARRLGKALGAYEVDSDFVKVRDPRYQDVGASGVHEESSEVALRATNLALSRRNNIITPVIGKNTEQLYNWMKELKDSGHTVYYVLADLSPEEASVRAFNRSLAKGRVIGPDYILNSVGTRPQSTFDFLKNAEDLVGGRFLRLDQAHPPEVPLIKRVLEHGPGFDRSLIEEATAADASGARGRRPGLDSGPDRGVESAAAVGIDRGLPRANPAVDTPSDLPPRIGPSAEAQAADVDLFGEPVRQAATGPAPWSIHEVPTADLHLDPKRFQWKQDVHADTGAGANLRGSRKFNPQLAGVIDVWRDPKDGLDYIINGHHRFNLAKRDGVERVNVRYIEAKDADEARAWGAIRNIASGKGTALDVAKFLRDSGETIEGLAQRGVDLKIGLAKEGVAIANLPSDLIDRLHRDPSLIRKAAVVGENLSQPDQQRAAFRVMEKLTERQTEELTKVIKAAGSENVRQEDLFGASSVAKSLFVEKAKVSAAIRERLAKDRRLFGYVANEGRAAELERGGNKINAKRSREIADKSAQLEELFDRLYQRGGPLGAIMDQAAKRVARGEKPGPVAESIYDDIQAAVQSELQSSGLKARAGAVGDQPELKPDEAYAQTMLGKGPKVGETFRTNDGRLATVKKVHTWNNNVGGRQWSENGFDLEITSEYGLPGTRSARPEKTTTGIAGLERRGWKPAKTGRAGSTNEAAGFELGGLSGAGLGGIAGSQVGDTPEERRRNALIGAALGAGAGAGAGRIGFRVISRKLAQAAEEAGKFDLIVKPERISVKIEGRPSRTQLEDLLEAVKANPRAGFRYVMTAADGRKLGGGNKLHELFADLPFGKSSPALEGARIGAIGDQDLFGNVEGPAQGGLFGEEVGKVGASRGKPFTAVQQEARDRADFLRKQLRRMSPGPARQKVAAEVADLDRISGFNDEISKEEMRTRAIAGRPGAVGDQPDRRYVPEAEAKTPDQKETRRIAQALKQGDPEAVRLAADEMAQRVPEGSILVPIPTSIGDTGANRALADAIAERSGSTVEDVLRRNRSVEASHVRRRAGKPGLTAEEQARSLRVEGQVPEGRVFLVDNIKTTGATFAGARRVLGRDAEGLAYAQAYIPTTERPARGPYKGESDLLNIAKIVEGSDAQERVAQAAEKYRGLKESQKQTWAEADPKIKAAVDELLANDPKARAPHIARKLTGVQLLARRDVIRANDNIIADLSKKLASGTLTVAETAQASELLSKAVQHNDALLSDIIIGAGQKGRDLNLLKRMSNKTLDHDVWQIQAKRMLGDRPLSDEISAQLRKLVNEAREACG
jgi:hypothetical protein